MQIEKENSIYSLIIAEIINKRINHHKDNNNELNTLLKLIRSNVIKETIFTNEELLKNILNFNDYYSKLCVDYMQNIDLLLANEINIFKVSTEIIIELQVYNKHK